MNIDPIKFAVAVLIILCFYAMYRAVQSAVEEQRKSDAQAAAMEWRSLTVNALCWGLQNKHLRMSAFNEYIQWARTDEVLELFTSAVLMDKQLDDVLPEHLDSLVTLYICKGE